jgi:hypothetical protein
MHLLPLGSVCGPLLAPISQLCENCCTHGPTLQRHCSRFATNQRHPFHDHCPTYVKTRLSRAKVEAFVLVGAKIQILM